MESKDTQSASLATEHAPPHPARSLFSSKAYWGWSIWEFATTPYLVLITAYLFGPYFANVIAVDDGGKELWTELQLIIGAIVAVSAPFLGVTADMLGPRKPWIAALTYAMIIPLALLWFSGPPGTEGTFSVFVIGGMIVFIGVCFELGMVFHNAMMGHIAGDKGVGKLSGFGAALGSFGSVVLLFALLAAFASPGDGSAGASSLDDWHFRVTGPIVAIWIAVFAMVFLRLTPDVGPSDVSLGTAFRLGARRFWFMMATAWGHKNVALFLVARMLYNDGMSAIVLFTGLYATHIFQWGMTELLIYGIAVICCGVIGAMMGGAVDHWMGSKRAALASVALGIIALTLSLSVTQTHILFFIPLSGEAAASVWTNPFARTWNELIYFGAGGLVAISMTAGYTSSRSLLVKIAPPERLNEFFGLYAFSGKATAFAAPLLIFILMRATDDFRLAVSSILAFLASGWLLLLFVKEQRKS